jgi:hypothetical protein
MSWNIFGSAAPPKHASASWNIFGAAAPPKHASAQPESSYASLGRFGSRMSVRGSSEPAARGFPLPSAPAEAPPAAAAASDFSFGDSGVPVPPAPSGFSSGAAPAAAAAAPPSVTGDFSFGTSVARPLAHPLTLPAATATWKVFHSHAWTDKPAVLPIKAALDAAGIPGWIDERQLEGGDALFGQIADGIDRADVVLLYLSPAYITRENCRMEVALAADYGKRLLPILLPGTPWPLRPSHGEHAGEIYSRLAGKLFISAQVEGRGLVDKIVGALGKMGVRAAGGGDGAARKRAAGSPAVLAYADLLQRLTSTMHSVAHASRRQDIPPPVLEEQQSIYTHIFAAFRKLEAHGAEGAKGASAVEGSETLASLLLRVAALSDEEPPSALPRWLALRRELQAASASFLP